MPSRIHSQIRTAALCAEMVMHAALFGLIAAAMFVQKSGAHELLQFSMDTVIMFLIVAFLLFRERYRNATGPNLVPNVVCFSLIFLLSLTGAVGLAIRAGSGSVFCEEFLSSDPEKCREASWAIALSWGSVIVAITGILVSCFDKHSGPAEAIKLSTPHQSSRDIESLRHQFQSETGDVPPRIHISRPRALSTASRSQGPYQAGGPAQPAPAYTLPRQPRRNRDPSSSRPFDRDESGGRTLVLNRQVTRAVGQAPRNQATFMRTDDTRIPPVRRKESKADERDMWKRKYLV